MRFPSDGTPPRPPIRRGGLESAYRRAIEEEILSRAADAAAVAVARETESNHLSVKKMADYRRRTKHGTTRRAVRLPHHDGRFILTVDITLWSEDQS